MGDVIRTEFGIPLAPQQPKLATGIGNVERIVSELRTIADCSAEADINDYRIMAEAFNRVVKAMHLSEVTVELNQS